MRTPIAQRDPLDGRAYVLTTVNHFRRLGIISDSAERRTGARQFAWAPQPSRPTSVSRMTVRALRFAVGAFLLAATARHSAAQAAVAVDTSQSLGVKVFLNCQNARCDFDFFRDQMRWVNWVRDRQFADVQLLVTSLRTGSGGNEYTIAAIGNDRYRGRADTVKVSTLPNDADDVVRRSLARTFSLMLAPYAAKSPLAPRLALTYTVPEGWQAETRPPKDRWNYWVYRVSANGFANGEKQQKSINGFFNASANRVTEAWKIGINGSFGYDESRFDLGDDGIFVNLLRNYGGNVTVVKSVTDHWSAGGSLSAQHSDYFNHKLNARLAAAVEYNVFPYKDFTRRQLTAYYQLGMAAYQYREITLYGLTEEQRPVHNGSVAWNARQPWGNVSVSLFGSQYLHDLSFYSVGVGGNINLRIAKGLAVNLGGNYSKVNDQLYLQRGELDDNQIIARQQALATSFRYFGSVGLSYTFGAISNSIVNPRFSGRGGEF